VHAAHPTHSRIEGAIADEIFLEEEADEEIRRSPTSSRGNRQVLEAVNVVQDFARPAVPSMIPRSQILESQKSAADEAMGTLTSTSKPTRPGLVSQHQLATPASTTTSTASSSLKQGYATFLRNSNGRSQIVKLPIDH
jgi:bloom syndrome protein